MEIKNPITFKSQEVKFQPVQDDLFEALILEGIIDKQDKWDVYKFLGKPIPRVSEILRECIGKDYLMKWALNLGKENYDRESNYTLYTGTLVHELIENFLLYGAKKEIDYRAYPVRMKTEKAYQNFLSWYRDMVNNGYEIKPIEIEQEVTCPWYGGTIDCIMNISNKSIDLDHNYIVDFKTSKQISIDYFLQTYSYLWALLWNRTEINPNIPKIDGLGIIRVDKEKPQYETLFLRYNNPAEARILTDLDSGFASMVNWYYHLINLNYDLKQAKKMERQQR